jgi:invasion protein IalB
MRKIMNSSMSFRAGILGAVVILGVGAQAIAQTPKPAVPAPVAKPEAAQSIDADPSSTLASFGDWTLRCQRIGNGADKQRVCEVSQQIRAQDQQSAVAELAIGRLKKADPLRMTIVLPVNVTLSSAPGLSGDGKAPELLDLGWRKCLPGGCIADALLKDDVLRRWKAEPTVGRITWVDAGGRDLAIGLSFRGLSQALDALSKEL